MSQPVLSWTARGLRVRQTRDALQPPEVATYVADASGNSEILTEFGWSMGRASHKPKRPC